MLLRKPKGGRRGAWRGRERSGTPVDLGVNPRCLESDDVPAVPALAGHPLPKSGAEAGVKRPNHLQTLKFNGTLDDRGCRLTRGARLRYPRAYRRAACPRGVSNLRPGHSGRNGAR